MKSREAYFDYLTRRLDNGESDNVAIYATADSIERQLAKKERVRVLDVGCFSGAMLNRILREVPEDLRERVDLFGVDSDIEAMEHGRKKYGNVEYHSSDIETGIEVEGEFDVILLANVLHELFPNEELGVRRRLVSEVFVGVTTLLADEGEVVMLDGLRPDDPGKLVEVHMVSEDWVRRFERLQREYTAADLSLNRLGGTRVRTNALSLSVLITKARYLDEEYWGSEARQLYQYNDEVAYRRMVEEAGLCVIRFEPQLLKESVWGEMVTRVESGDYLPVKNVLVVSRRPEVV